MTHGKRSGRKPQANQPPQRSPEQGKGWTGALKWVLPPIVAIFIPLYVYGPDVHPRNVFITCAICDSAAQIHPPTSSADNGATFTVTVENTGSMGTTLLDHNLTLMMDPDRSDPRAFVENADSNDHVEVPIGAHSVAYLTFPTNEAIVYDMRHGLPTGSSVGPIVRPSTYLYGHLTFRRSVGIPATTNFCFKYFPPNKGLPESWGVCANDVVARIEAARSS